MLIRNLLSLFGYNRGQEERQENSKLAPVVTEKASILTLSGKYDKDVKAIVAKYGELTEGLHLETTLQELLVIVPRHRQRVDAYNGLVSELKNRYGVSLTIKSRKTR